MSSGYLTIELSISPIGSRLACINIKAQAQSLVNPGTMLSLKASSILFGLLAITSTWAKPQNPVSQNPQLRNWGIVDSSQDQYVHVGQTISLYCRVGGDGITENDDWKTCIWRREIDGAKCQIYYRCDGGLCGIGVGDFTQVLTCDTPLNDVSFYGDDPNIGNKMCGINIPRAGYEDDSPWTCVIEECDLVGCGTSDGNGEFSQATIEVYVS